jgi:hypothetical protein
LVVWHLVGFFSARAPILRTGGWKVGQRSTEKRQMTVQNRDDTARGSTNVCTCALSCWTGGIAASRETATRPEVSSWPPARSLEHKVLHEDLGLPCLIGAKPRERKTHLPGSTRVIRRHSSSGSVVPVNGGHWGQIHLKWSRVCQATLTTISTSWCSSTAGDVEPR